MIHIFLIRHAESLLYEENSLVNDASALPVLTETGLQQANLIAKRLSNYTINHLLSSPHKRTMETARLIAKYHPVEIEVREELREQDRGPLISTIKSTDIERLFPNEWQGWQSGNADYAPPGGESIDAFLSRVDAMLAEMESRTGLVVAITHFGFIQGAVCLVLGVPFRFRLPVDINETSITHIRSENGKRILATFNDTGHFQIPF